MLLPRLATLLTGLTWLAWLAVSAELALLILLTGWALALPLLAGLAPLLPLLSIARRGIAHPAGEGFHLVAKPLNLVEGFLRILLLAIEGLLRLVQGIVEALHAVGYALILAVLRRIDSAANPIRTLPEAVLQVILFHAAEGVAQFGSGSRLRSAKSARGLLHLLFELAERVGGLLAIIAKLGLLLALVQPIGGVAMSKHLAHARFLILLLFLKPIRFAGHGVHLLRGFSLLHPAQQVGSFLQAFGGTPRSGIIWLCLRSRSGHIFLGLTQAIERLLHAVIS